MSLKNKVSKLITVMQKNPIGFTENGAFTNMTTSDAVTDLFFVAGATRSRTEDQIISQVKAAWATDPELTAKLLFWARDVLQGAGERRFFRIAIKWLAQEHAEKFAPAVKLVPEYGRWDDLLTLFGTPLEDPALVDRIVDDGLTLTVCPLSNLKLGVTKTVADSPIRAMLASDVRATINSDDPAYFGGYINANYEAVAEALDLDLAELATLAANSFAGSFLPQTEKDARIAEIEAIAARFRGRDDWTAAKA